MSTGTTPARASAGPSARAVLRRLTRHGGYPGTRVLVLLVALPLAIVAGVAVDPTTVPFTSLMVPLLLGSLLLAPRHLPWFVLWVLVSLGVCVALQVSLSPRTWGAIGIQVLMCAIVLGFSLRRSRLGVGGATGESMFVDLRDRILAQGGIPELPPGWRVESALRSAGGTPFAGDFLVATRPTPERLEIAVVDVSGKGEEAGTRALQLSGVFGGLLGAVPPDRFLTSANDYLLRQDWAEGFATAVHLSLDLAGGAFVVRSAGHPPAVLRAGGRWSLVDSSGPVLGLVPDADFDAAAGRLEVGDSVLLYTDGMVEEPRRDLDEGIERLVREADTLLRSNDTAGVAHDLVEALGSPGDDRALVVLTRG